jgi:hypothetical protein
VFNPFLGFIVSDVWIGKPCAVSRSYLNVFVEIVCDVLSRGPAAEVLVLHLLNPLDGVFGD